MKNEPYRYQMLPCGHRRGTFENTSSGATLPSSTSARIHMFHMRRAQTAAARARALLEDGEPLEEPVRLHLVGRERLAEDLVHEGWNALDVIRVQDVRVLVRDELEVPVVDVAERRHVVGRGDVQPDRVVRQRRRRAVRAVGLIR